LEEEEEQRDPESLANRLRDFEGDEKDGSDVETILSLSDGEHAEEGQLSVTLDFPC
jgi:hypothetical protein